MMMTMTMMTMMTMTMMMMTMMMMMMMMIPFYKFRESMDDFPFLLTLLGSLFFRRFLSIECQDADQEAAAAGVSCLSAIGEVCPNFFVGAPYGCFQK